MLAKKRIAVFLDGTSNSVEANTNIWRLRSLNAEEDAIGCRRDEICRAENLGRQPLGVKGRVSCVYQELRRWPPTGSYV
jgi:hypothetical protein